MSGAMEEFTRHYRQLGRGLLVDIAEKVGMPIELAEARAGQIDRELVERTREREGTCSTG